MNKQDQEVLYLYGYVDHPKKPRTLMKVAETRLANSSEEWDACSANRKKMLELYYEHGVMDCEQVRGQERGYAVKELMSKHFGVEAAIIKQETYWPGRTQELWKGTTTNMRELFLYVERSDGQHF